MDIITTLTQSQNDLFPGGKMAKVIHGDRIGKTAKIRLGCSVTIFDSTGQKIFLTQRTDNNLWCLPGGAVDPGESVAEAAVREVMEEAGLSIQVKRLIGVYSCPNRVVEYADGNRWQIVALNFEGEILAGEPCCSDEVSAFGFYSFDEMKSLQLMDHHWERIEDAFARQDVPFLR
jgi:8-oxo-dGTP pyrophosphatase MutT (NUDIX family)